MLGIKKEDATMEKKIVAKPTSKVIEKPWGTEEIIAEGDNYKVKRMVINPGETTSLQYHRKRSEYWTFVDADKPGYAGRSAKHRLENLNGKKPITIIEVQVGDCNDADIVRLKDKYGRA